jgi:hypothetical protein
MAVNVERILALADLIEKQPHTKIEDDSGFNMDRYRHDCGTPACIAGWAASVESGNIGGYIPGAGYTWATAQNFLGLRETQAQHLFAPYGADFDLYDWVDITPKMAATTLRNLAETGEVNWRAE